MVRMSSLFGSKVHRFSFSKKTSTPLSFNFLTKDIVSSVLRANREMDFVIMRSILPAKASDIILLNSGRLLVLVHKKEAFNPVFKGGKCFLFYYNNGFVKLFLKKAIRCFQRA